MSSFARSGRNFVENRRRESPKRLRGAAASFLSFAALGVIPGHALLEKGLQRQKDDGPLVSIQEDRAFLVPLINRE